MAPGKSGQARAASGGGWEETVRLTAQGVTEIEESEVR